MIPAHSLACLPRRRRYGRATLLRRAQEAGLAVQAEGDRLIIRGPKRAESVARLLIDHKRDVLAALAPREAARVPDEDVVDRACWRDRYATRIVHRFRRRHPWQEAERLAFGELILAWHRQHGASPDPGRCAGCGDDLPEDAGLAVDRGGARVHFDGVRGIDCIIGYGARWRGAAMAGLQAIGLHPPEGFELL
jgi:hypothetical protein